MKTLSYHTEKEIRIGITIVVFIMAVFATIKVRELQLSEKNYAEGMSADRIELSPNNFSTMPVADAQLIEEPMQASETITTTNTSVNDHELALQMKTMVNKGEFWSDEIVENDQELALQMTTWLKNGTYYNSDDAGELPATKYANQASPANKGTMDTETMDKELASQMKTWINKGDYWSVANN